MRSRSIIAAVAVAMLAGGCAGATVEPSSSAATSAATPAAISSQSPEPTSDPWAADPASSIRASARFTRTHSRTIPSRSGWRSSMSSRRRFRLRRLTRPWLGSRALSACSTRTPVSADRFTHMTCCSIGSLTGGSSSERSMVRSSVPASCRSGATRSRTSRRPCGRSCPRTTRAASSMASGPRCRTSSSFMVSVSSKILQSRASCSSDPTDRSPRSS